MGFRRRDLLRGIGATSLVPLTKSAVDMSTAAETSGAWSQVNYGFRQTTYQENTQGPVESAGFEWQQSGLTGGDPGDGFARASVTDGQRVYLVSNGAHALDPKTGEHIWSSESRAISRAPPVVVDDTVYYANDDSELYALNAATGETQWTLSFAESGDLSPWGLTSRNGTLYLSGYVIGDNSRGGFIKAVDTTGQTIRWSADVSEWPSPVAVGDEALFYTVNFDSIEARGRNSGNRLWTQSIDVNGVVYAPALSGSSLYVPTLRGLAHVTTSGDLRWTSEVEGIEPTSPVLTDDFAILAFTNGSSEQTAILTAFRRDTEGTVEWSVQEEERAFQQPVAVGDTIYVGGRHGRLYAYDLRTGDRRWVIEGEQSHLTAPVIVNGTLILGSRSVDKIYGITADGTQLPEPSITGPGNVYPGEEVTFDGMESTDPDGELVNYEWTVNRSPPADSPIQTSSGQEITLTFDQPDSYKIILETFDNAGLSATAAKEVSVDSIHLSLRRAMYTGRERTVKRVAGTPFTARFEIDNYGEQSIGATLSLSLPENIPMTGHEDAGGTWTGNGWEWSPIPADSTRIPAVTLEPPEDMQPGQYPLNVTLKSPFGESLESEQYILQIVKEPTPVRQELLDDEEEVTQGGVERALNYWKHDQIVGGTGGERVSDDLLLDLIRSYFSSQEGGQ